MYTLKNGYIFLIFCTILFLFACTNASKNDEVQTHTVEIILMKFQPAEIVVQKGDKVIFINRDIVNHDVTEQDKKWNSSPIISGSSWTLTVEASQNYYCSLHPVMKGKITIQE